jgi:hypothetical protein
VVRPAAIAPLAPHVLHHAEQLPHDAIQKFIVVFNHAFQIFHALAHRLHGLETLVDQCVELRDGVTASRTTHRMRPERVVIARVAVVVAAVVAVVWTSLDPLPRWVPGPTTRWAPGTT